MEIPLDHGVDDINVLMKVGAEHAHDIDALCTDIASVIFPTAVNPPTEATISAVSAKLIQLVSDLEARLLSKRNPHFPLTWDILSKSGFLREPDLIDFILARVAEDRLGACIAQDKVKSASAYLDHQNGMLADAAQTLLAAESLHRSGAGNTYLGLTSELLYKLTWQIVAAIEIFEGARQPAIIASAKSLLSSFCEADRAQDAARKIVHFSDDPTHTLVGNPEIYGLHLHVAALSADLELDHDHILRLIDASSSAPYAVMLAACGVSKTHALKNIFLFRGDLITPREAGIFESGYANLQADEASIQIGYWASARAQFLSGGKLP
jgi:hypothetical protein